MSLSPVRATIDLDGPGRRVGHLLVPESRNDGAWSMLPVPIAAVGRGDGPVALVLGGNHGDEYEGQVAILDLIASVGEEDVPGRLLLMPCLSLAASRGGTRLWPSGANFNRLFPGAADGPPEQMLAHYLTHVLFPAVDIVVDVHSGGRSLLFHPMTTMTRSGTEDPERRRRMIDAMLAWNADFHMTYEGAGQTGLLPAEAERQGKLVLTTEMGGGGFFTAPVIVGVKRGLRNMLRHLGVLAGDPETRASLGLPDTVFLRSSSAGGDVLSPGAGIYETMVHPGDVVTAGQRVGRLYDVERPDRPAEEIVSAVDGVVAAVRAMPATRPGDVLATLAEVCDRGQIEAPAA